MFKDIINNVTRFVVLTKDEKEEFTNLLEHRFIKAKTILLQKGEVCQFEGYVQKGCIRTYYIDEKGFEVTLYFAIEDWWVSDIASFHDQKPSRLYIEALEDSEIYLLTPQTKEILLKTIPKFEKVLRILVQRNLITLQDRLVNTISKPATERYLDFIKAYPSVPLRVPQYYIASYLGVSKEFVSTIRKRLSNK
ncbi:Crp/Fnr family transcriptional regulator [Chryseobacterium pennipullorum]|uniref:Crp/Fnr family transcriptional regulator n=1 Tax=Chryseobacterium pennipullorum TaxID=2258963 RepID=A0A3D9B0J2_9FLAO|nr:Crp/Fnr family transcriptional regulator [Chryseobacterium pennipullorum]REC46722.1 Crp/Fnr family transcriptional regulator [Chryseobacterium pennipullorum]